MDAKEGEVKEQDKQKQNEQPKDKGQPKFDWVTERFSCSLPRVLKDLMLQVEEDVKTRNGLRPEYAPYEFSITENGDNFTVLLEADDVHRSVTFTLAGHAILVQDGAGNQMFEVTLTFADDGKCKLNVDKKEREPWQVRRMALESLMFHPN